VAVQSKGGAHGRMQTGASRVGSRVSRAGCRVSSSVCRGEHRGWAGACRGKRRGRAGGQGVIGSGRRQGVIKDQRGGAEQRTGAGAEQRVGARGGDGQSRGAVALDLSRGGGAR
jgi:hypothetical protein